MKQYGLIGFPLSHSFSKKYFGDKFQREGIEGCAYDLFEIEDIKGFPQLVQGKLPELKGLNVTIPHKENVIPFMDEMDPAAKEIGAVNVIKVMAGGKLKGYNSDYYGFRQSLENFAGADLKGIKALVLGTGGASKAVKQALRDLGIDFQSVSRKASEHSIAYSDLTPEMVADHKLIINSTPLGMHPKVDTCPDLPYEVIGEGHYLYDLVYNPEETLFMKKGRDNGAKAIHGLEMLELQAEKAWEIWNEDQLTVNG